MSPTKQTGTEKYNYISIFSQEFEDMGRGKFILCSLDKFFILTLNLLFFIEH